ncbi:HAD hydrolase family protein, partial [Acinetobacter baumannii]
EFLAYGCSKGKALQALCGSLDVDQSEVAAIGDFLNDVEMVDWASLGGAVGNAHEAVKRVAQVVVASNDDGGVAEFIERYVLAAA